MRPVAALLPFEAARGLVDAALLPTARTETLPLVEALGRALATDLHAPIDVPGFDRSAMDGYAVQGAETARATKDQPVRLRLRGAVHAGPLKNLQVGRGECAQIATGAPVPAGADAVVMVEQTRREGETVLVERPVRARENVSPRGGDIRQGTTVIAAGTVLTAPRIAAFAALGLGTATVYDRPRVGLVSTGTELRTPGQDLAPGLIYDSNTPTLESVLRQHHAAVERLGLLPDEPGRLEATLKAAAPQHDLLLVTGSSSAGERDYLAEAMVALGSVTFHGVSVKPGKPLLLGKLGATPVVGLAGNPASCTMMTYALLLPALRAWQHLPRAWAAPVPARLAAPITSARGKRHFVPVRIRDGRAESTYKESDATTSLANADGFVEIPDDVEQLQADAPVSVTPF